MLKNVIKSVLGALGVAIAVILLCLFLFYLWTIGAMDVWMRYGDNAFLYYLIGSAVSFAIFLVVVW